MTTRRSKETQPAPVARTARPRRKKPAEAAAAQPPELSSAVIRVTVVPDARRGMIAEAAYLRAEHRGFTPGSEVEDWLAAEREIDALLSARGARQ